MPKSRNSGFVSVARQNFNNSCEHQKITSFHSQHFQPSTAECEHAYMKSGNNYGNPEFGSNLIIVSYNSPLKNIWMISCNLNIIISLLTFSLRHSVLNIFIHTVLHV